MILNLKCSCLPNAEVVKQNKKKNVQFPLPCHISLATSDETILKKFLHPHKPVSICAVGYNCTYMHVQRSMEITLKKVMQEWLEKHQLSLKTELEVRKKVKTILP